MMLLNPYKVGTGVVDPSEFIIWQGKINVTETALSTLQVNATGSWTGSAYSQQQAAAGAFKAQMKLAPPTDGQVIIGLINATTALSAIFHDVSYGVLIYAGDLYSLESGGAVAGLGVSVTTADIVSVEITAGGVIQYKKNSSVVGTVSTPSITYPIKAMAFLEYSATPSQSKMTECKVTL